MDFYSMPRRQLQALCKQNRIPANITNVAMAGALEALHADGSLENAQEVLQDLTPLVPSSRKASLHRQAPATVVNFEVSIEPREQPASPLPRARRVIVKASEIQRFAVEGEENEKEEVEVEKEAVGEATPMTVTNCSSTKPPPRSTRRASKKNDVEAKEEEPIDAMKTPAPLTGRRTAARKLAKTPVVAADTVVSARITTRRNTRQSTRATIQDSAATSTVRRSSRIRAKTEESALKMGSSLQEVEPEQGRDISNALEEEDDNGEKDCDLAVVDSDVPQNSLEEAVIAPEANEFATVAVVSEEEQLDKGEDDNGDKDCDLAVVDSDVPQNSLEEAVIAPEAKEFATVAVVSEEEQLDQGEDEVEVDDHCEKGCTLVVVGANILMDDLEEDRITPNAEELGLAKDELIDMPTEEALEVDVKESVTVAQQHLVSLQLHLFLKNDEEKPMAEKDDLVDEIVPEDEQFTDVKAPMDMITEKDDLVVEIAPEDEQFTDVNVLGNIVQHHEGGDSKDDSDINEDGGIHGDQHQVVNVIQESEVSTGEVLPETKCDFEGSPVQGLISSLENLEITKDLHLEDLAPKDDETKHAADDHAKDIDEGFHLGDIPDNEVETMSSDLEAKTTGEVIAVTKCQLSGADKENVHLEDLPPEVDETKHEIPSATLDSFIQNQASDIPEKAKTAGEVIAVTKCQLFGADKENDQYSAELSTDVVVNEDQKQNVEGNLEAMSLRRLKKMYKEKIIISNVDKVETKRQALNDVNQNIVS